MFSLRWFWVCNILRINSHPRAPDISVICITEEIRHWRANADLQFPLPTHVWLDSVVCHHNAKKNKYNSSFKHTCYFLPVSPRVHNKDSSFSFFFYPQNSQYSKLIIWRKRCFIGDQKYTAIFIIASPPHFIQLFNMLFALLLYCISQSQLCSLNTECHGSWTDSVSLSPLSPAII